MSTRQTIKKLLKRAKKFRHDDRVLTLAVWESYGFTLTPEQRVLFLKLPSAETIGRRRREFRAEFPDDKETQERRFERFKEYQDNYSPHKWSRWLRRQT